MARLLPDSCRLALALFVGLAMVACPEVSGIDRCATDDDCPQGFLCAPEDQLCRARDVATDAGRADAILADGARGDFDSVDSASTNDANARDASAQDVSAQDVSALDVSTHDTGTHDAGSQDNGTHDGGIADSGAPDITAPDAAAPDSSAPDSASPDAGDGFPAHWWDSDWPHRIRLRLHNAESGEAFTRLPILIKLTPGHVVYDLCLQDGSDLRFVDEQNNLLRHEVERWVIDGTSFIWLTAPEVEARSARTSIYLYLGNTLPVPQANASAWPEEYELVVLFKGSSANEAFVDSSPANRAISSGAYLESPGIHGNSAEIGVGQFLEVESLWGGGFPQDQGTLSFWAWSDDWTNLNAWLLDDDEAESRSYLGVGVQDETVSAVPADAESAGELSGVQASVPAQGWGRFAVVWGGAEAPAQLQLFRTASLIDSSPLPDDWRPSGQRFVVNGVQSGNVSLYLDNLRLARAARTSTWFRMGWLVEKDMYVIYERTPVPPEPERGQTSSGVAPLVLYEFDEATGDIVHDTAANGLALDLTIADTSAVEWLGGALRIERGTMIESGTADKIIEQCSASDALTVEAWVQPDSALFRGPARIVSLAADNGSSNFMLGQTLSPSIRGRARYALRLRTTETDDLGRLDTGTERIVPMTADADGERPAPRRQQVVFTWDGSEVCSYLDGGLSSMGCEPWIGDVGSVWTGETLTLANEYDQETRELSRPWFGTYYRVAIYCQALTAGEVLSSFQTGNAP